MPETTKIGQRSFTSRESQASGGKNSVRFVPPLVRIKAALRGRIESVADPDGYRLGGVLYIAPKDPALFVARKGGYGSTLNLGRPGAWLFLLVLVVVPLVFAWALSSR